MAGSARDGMTARECRTAGEGAAGPAGAGPGRDQTEKEDPQPQVVEALGLRMTNWAPWRFSV